MSGWPQVAEDMVRPGRADHHRPRRRGRDRRSAATTRRWTSCAAASFTQLLSDDWAHGVEAAVDIALLGRYYERIADHAVSVANRVVFVVTGENPAPWAPVGRLRSQRCDSPMTLSAASADGGDGLTTPAV